MPVNQSSDDLLFIAYRDVGPSPALIVPAILLNTVAIPGVFANLFVVYVTVVSKSLRGTAHFLLALISLLEVLHQSGHTIFLAIALSGTNFIANLDALHLEAAMVFGINATFIAMLCAAFDRLFAVVAKQIHRRLKVAVYLGTLSALCCLYGLFALYKNYQIIGADPERPTTGCVVELFIDDDFFSVSSLNLNVLTGALYVVVGLAVRFKKGVTKETNARLMRSLLIIVGISVGGYFFNLSFLWLLVKLQHLSPILIWELEFINAILLNLGAASNAPILYWSSSEYRKAFRQQFQQQQTTRLFQIRATQVNPSAFPSSQGNQQQKMTGRTGSPKWSAH